MVFDENFNDIQITCIKIKRLLLFDGEPGFANNYFKNAEFFYSIDHGLGVT